MITTNIHLRGCTLDRAYIDTGRGDGEATVVQTLTAPGGGGSGVTLFCDPQQAIELGHALVQQGIRAQQIADVAAATKAALEESL